MSQFDQTTERKAEVYSITNSSFSDCPTCNGKERGLELGFEAGRNAAKESLEILAKALLQCKVEYAFRGLPSESKMFTAQVVLKLEDAIAQVKARGDWPLGEV